MIYLTTFTNVKPYWDDRETITSFYRLVTFKCSDSNKRTSPEKAVTAILLRSITLNKNG